MKVAILGKDSFIARSIEPLLIEHEVVSYTREELDVTNKDQVRDVLGYERFDAVINTAVRGGKRLKYDTADVFYDNVLMVENLLRYRDLYSQLFLFGSGAEYRATNITPERKEYYGLSKYINTQRVYGQKNVINLRLFNVFGPLEDENRFIKTAIKNYINKQPIEIWNDKFFDFFYVEDLFTVINHFIKNSPKEYAELNCVYKHREKLSEVAKIINKLSNYKVPINIGGQGKDYCSNGTELKRLGLEFIGLKAGIKKTYEALKNG